MFVVLLLACHEGQTPPFPATTLDPADAVAAADLDGDGADELLLVREGVLRWPGGEVTLGGAVQAVARGDSDKDGKEEAWLATGSSRDLREAPMRLWRVDHKGATQVWERSGPRNQISELRVVAGRVWFSAFSDERTVQAGWLEDGALKVVREGALMTRQLPLGDALVSGRIYGDQPRSDGDLRLSQDGQAERVLPTLRGVRALNSADLNQDGQPELLVGDGWHYDYGERALARVLLLSGPTWTDARVIAHLSDDYSVRDIQVVGQDLLVVGARSVHLLRRDSLGWADSPLGAVAEQGNAVAVRTPSGWGVMISGAPTRLVPFPTP